MNKFTRSAAATFVAVLLCTPAQGDAFRTRDQNPVLADFGLSDTLPAQVLSDAWWVSTDLNWGSSAIAQADGEEFLLVDAETRELRLSVLRDFGERFAIRLQLPYRYIGPGVLDGAIDDWHDLFGLPEGARPLLAKDRLRIRYARAGRMLIDQRSSQSGLANASVDLGYRLLESQQTSLTSWLSTKLPTSTHDGFGKETIDVSLVLAGAHRFSGRWSVFAQGGVTYLQEDPQLEVAQQRWVGSAMFGASVRAWRHLEFKIQLNSHTSVSDTELDYLGSTAILTFGGAYRFASGWLLDVGVSEDIDVDAAPDVVFVLGLARSLAQ